jgi:hypothetical protein
VNTTIQIFEHREMRVLTTKQLADFYGVQTAIISNNFKRNEDRFRNGVHFFRLEDQELRAFRSNHQIDDSWNKLNVLYLWTEKGAARHAKILNTDKAWDVFEELEDTYFRVRESKALPPTSKGAFSPSDTELLNSIADSFTQNVILPVYHDVRALKAGHQELKAELGSLRRIVMQFIAQDGTATPPPVEPIQAPSPRAHTSKAPKRIEMQYEPPKAGSVVLTNIKMLTLEDYCTAHRIHLTRRERQSVSRKIATRCLHESAPMYRRIEFDHIKANEYPEYIIREMLAELLPSVLGARAEVLP